MPGGRAKFEGGRPFDHRKALLCGIPAIVLAAVAGSNAVGNAALSTRPDLAAHQLGANPTARLIKPYQSMLSTGGRAAVRRTEALAKRSIQDQAINPAAFSLLGVIATVEGNERQAERYFTISYRQSRRERMTTLWLIENNIAKGSISGALRHYDEMLRVFPETGQALYPIIDSALADKEIQAAFVPYLDKNTPWLSSYMRFAVSDSKAPENFALTLLRAGGLRKGLQLGLDQGALFRRLFQTGQYSVAKSLFLYSYPREASLLTSAGLQENSIDDRFSPFGWELQQTAAVNGLLTPLATGGGYTLDVQVGSGERGVAASKVLYLSPGRYELAGTLQFSRQGEGSLAMWHASCLRRGKQKILGSSSDLAGNGRGYFQFVFQVPATCEISALSLEAAGGDGQLGSEFTIAGLQLKKR